MIRPTLRRLALPVVAALLTTSCADSSAGGAVDSSQADSQESSQSEAASSGLRLVSAADGAAIQEDPPADLVILDVRTPEEFAESRLDGAVMIDFYNDDFADQLAELDPDVPYLLYCRSGNRSGQTIAIMEELGFTNVADVDGGILSWTDAGLPTVSG